MMRTEYIPLICYGSDRRNVGYRYTAEATTEFRRHLWFDSQVSYFIYPYYYYYFLLPGSFGTLSLLSLINGHVDWLVSDRFIQTGTCRRWMFRTDFGFNINRARRQLEGRSPQITIPFYSFIIWPSFLYLVHHSFSHEKFLLIQPWTTTLVYYSWYTS